MQLAVIEYARNVVGINEATSVEFDENAKEPIIYLMTEWYDFRKEAVEKRDEMTDKGGTLRLGAYPCKVRPETNAMKAYGDEMISERHRHRYEFNNAYYKQLEEAGMSFSGVSPDESLVEIVEVKDHPWFLACQFHPEFKSTPMNPHPLFRDFIKASKENSK